jgi:hypothetical protein
MARASDHSGAPGGGRVGARPPMQSDDDPARRAVTDAIALP